MQRRITDPVSHSCCYMDENKCLYYWKCNSCRRSSGLVRSCTFKIQGHFEFSPIEFLKQVAEMVTKALPLVTARRRPIPEDSSSSGKSRPVGASVDSHRTAAVEDCIEFIHSSFSISNYTTSYQDHLHTL